MKENFISICDIHALVVFSGTMTAQVRWGEKLFGRFVQNHSWSQQQQNKNRQGYHGNNFCKVFIATNL